MHISSGTLLDIFGAIGDDPGSGWDVAGVSSATKDHTLVRKSTVLSGNSGDWTLSGTQSRMGHPAGHSYKTKTQIFMGTTRYQWMVFGTFINSLSLFSGITFQCTASTNH